MPYDSTPYNDIYFRGGCAFVINNEFKNAYKDDDMVLYVYLVDNDGKLQDIITEIIKEWIRISMIQLMHLYLSFPMIWMLYVQEGVHRLRTWRCHIQNYNVDDNN
jgi:hypothetical protein